MYNNYSGIEATVANYAQQHTRPEPQLLQHLVAATQAVEGANMISSREVGRLLKMLVNISKAINILEIGTFTGYSALSMAEALPSHGKLYTIDVAYNNHDLAKKYIALSPHGYKVKTIIGKGLDKVYEFKEKIISGELPKFDMIFIDADKANYPQYFVELKQMVKSGGIMIFDNVVWQKRVLQPLNNRDQQIAELNRMICNDPEVENVLLTVKDGLNIVRKI